MFPLQVASKILKANSTFYAAMKPPSHLHTKAPSPPISEFFELRDGLIFNALQFYCL